MPGLGIILQFVLQGSEKHPILLTKSAYLISFKRSTVIQQLGFHRLWDTILNLIKETKSHLKKKEMNYYSQLCFVVLSYLSLKLEKLHI